MAGFFQNFLGGFTNEFFGNKYLRDYRHASKTFIPNAYGYSPKFKFLFHTFFDINKQLIGATGAFPEDQNFGLAVKTVQLPKFSFDIAEMNQYNRRRLVQTKIKYDPISITFHDDNSNLIRQLWYTYYTYYYKDSVQPDIDSQSFSYLNAVGKQQKFDYNARNIYTKDTSAAPDWGYIGEGTNSQQTLLGNSVGAGKAPFFRAINIYGFNQHNFVLYRLMNPLIDSFSHDTYDYSAGNGTMENSMTIKYETVKYYTGALNGAAPGEIVLGFGSDDHYDRTLSPIARVGSNASILGQGGLVDAGVGIIDDLYNGNILGAIQKAGRAYNTFKNPQTILNVAKDEFKQIVLGAITNPTSTRNKYGLYFPTAGTSGEQAPPTIGGLKVPPDITPTPYTTNQTSQ